MKVSFSGTRKGMTPKQEMMVAFLLGKLNPTEVHHGDCIGADEDFAAICGTVVEPRPRIIAHPGESARGGDNKLRADSPYNDEIRPVKPFLVRNKDIVEEGDCLIATPADPVQTVWSGTWYTVGYAEGLEKKVYVVKPDGTVEETKK